MNFLANSYNFTRGKFSLFSLLPPLPFPRPRRHSGNFLGKFIQFPKEVESCRVADSFYYIWFGKGLFHIEDVAFCKILHATTHQLKLFIESLLELVKNQKINLNVSSMEKPEASPHNYSTLKRINHRRITEATEHGHFDPLFQIM